MELISNAVLGRQVEQQPVYSAQLLHAIDRAQTRALLGLDEALPFVGSDRWTGYELSWLNRDGKPQVAILRCVFGADSPSIIESKSFKLYLNTYSRERLKDARAVHKRIAADLAAACGGEVAVEVLEPPAWPRMLPQPREGICLDSLPLQLDPDDIGLRPDALGADRKNAVEEQLYTELFKSNCPVTGQPDWASVHIDYRGPAIDHSGLLRYLLSYREQREFHEQCVERIFIDISRWCRPQWLAVEARFTRRGGIDINPYRVSAGPAVAGDFRGWRQ